PGAGGPWQGVVGARLTRAVDERGADLVRAALPPAEGPEKRLDRPVVWDALSGRPAPRPHGRRAVPVWLPAGKQAANRLKEVSGVVSVQVSTVRELLSVEFAHLTKGQELTDAAGRAVKVLKVVRSREALSLEIQIRQQGTGAGAFQVVRGPKGV